MYSQEIQELINLKQQVITIQDYINIIQTSPQVDHILYNNDHFEMFTDDGYGFKFKIKEIKKTR
jgi:hypothetical protein